MDSLPSKDHNSRASASKWSSGENGSNLQPGRRSAAITATTFGRFIMPALAEPELRQDELFPLDDPEIEDQAAVEDDESDGGLRFSITSYGADYPVDALVKRLESGAIEVPRFQRGFVWTLPQSSRFIESLLLGLPVPAVFLSKHPISQRLLVIDGQQRLTSLRFFYEGIFRGNATPKEFALRGVSADLEGKTYKSLSDEDRRRLDDSLLHAIIVNQVDPKDDQTGLYSIFERINTGGTPLQPQEIRACIYEGPFIALLRSLATNSDWQTIYGEPSRRAKDQEMILRFLALRFSAPTYERPMKHFLNRFVFENRDLQKYDDAVIRSAFEPAVAIANRHLGRDVFRPVRNLNAAILDSILVGISTRLASGAIVHPDQLRPAVDALMQNREYSEAHSTATSDNEKVAKRIDLAIDAIAGVE